MSIAQRVGIIIIIWFGLSIVLIGTLTTERSKRKSAKFSKKDRDLMFRNARWLCLILAIAIGLIL